MDHGTLTKEVAEGLKVLRKRITDAKIPGSELDQTLNIATWNVREFGKKPRSEAAIHYIAEIIGQFDLVAVAELRDKLEDLGRVMQILGPYWKVLYSDYIADSPGNFERVGYVYDGRSIRFTGLAAEVDPKRQKNKSSGKYVEKISWWRSPYIASFRAGHFDFVLVTAHIQWGSSEKTRAEELTNLAKWVNEKIKEQGWDDKDIIVMGDFNIPSRDGPLYRAITLNGKGLRAPDALMKTDPGTNLEKNKVYDQIFHLPQYTKCFTDLGGVLDFYCGDHSPLFPNLDKDKFTYELSDHLPLWIQLKVDTLDEKIDQILGN
jgi:endonuclease/exonuclease/phosphatase family metal-dependent hydrolase